MKYLPLLFLMSCVPNTMHNHILDNKEITHIYLSDDIHNPSYGPILNLSSTATILTSSFS